MNLQEMSLEQLIIGAQNDAIGNYSSGYDGTPLDTDYKAELLRRFGELEKQVEDLKCCGNCIITDANNHMCSNYEWEGGKIVSRFNSKRILGGASDER